jgi:anti-sigma B factor antagonist
MDSLVVKERANKDITILDLEGKIRLGGGNIILRRTLNQLIQEGKTSILLNLAEVSHIDSSGLGELVAGFVSLQKVGGDLKLLNLNSRVREIMAMVKLLTIFDAFENEDEAINSFQSPAEKNVLKKSALATKNL